MHNGTFGDGEMATGLSAEHTYMSQDEFEVNVRVNNDDGLSDTKYVNLMTGIVHNRPSMIEESPELRTLSEKLAIGRFRARQSRAEQTRQ
jgi:hypothetical protein